MTETLYMVPHIVESMGVAVSPKVIPDEEVQFSSMEPGMRGVLPVFTNPADAIKFAKTVGVDPLKIIALEHKTVPVEAPPPGAGVLTVVDREAIKLKLRAGISQKELREEYRVSKSTIYRIKKEAEKEDAEKVQGSKNTTG